MRGRWLWALVLTLALGVFGTATAQAQTEPTPVIISGIELRDRTDFLPVGVLGRPRAIPAAVERAFQPLDINLNNDHPLRVTVPVPLLVENVGYKPAPRPGE